MTPRRGDIVLVVLQGDYGKPRPALVVQGEAIDAGAYDSIVVCPMTSLVTGGELCRVAVEPTPETGLGRKSEIMVEKLAGVPCRRLRDVIGHVDAETMRAVERAMLLVLGFGPRPEVPVRSSATQNP